MRMIQRAVKHEHDKDAYVNKNLFFLYRNFIIQIEIILNKILTKYDMKEKDKNKKYNFKIFIVK